MFRYLYFDLSLVAIILAAKEVSQSCSSHIWVYYYQYLDQYTGDYSKCSPGWVLQRKVSSKKAFMGDLWVFPANLGERGDFGCKPYGHAVAFLL